MRSALPGPSMPARRLSRRCCALSLLLLGGCSAVRLGYNQGPTWPSAGSTAMSTSTTRSRRGARTALDDWFAWHRAHAAARLRRAAGAAPRPRSLRDATPERDVRAGPTSCAAASTPASSRRVPAMADVVPHAFAGAARAHREALRARRTRSSATSSCSADPASGARGRKRSARSSAPRCSTAGSTTRSASCVARTVRRLAVRRRASGYAERQAAPAGHAGDAAPPARAERAAATTRRGQVRACAAARRSARRARPTARYQERLSRLQLRAGRARCTTAPRPSSGSEGARRSSRAGRTTCARWRATPP